jgi:hypothetical protein
MKGIFSSIAEPGCTGSKNNLRGNYGFRFFGETLEIVKYPLNGNAGHLLLIMSVSQIGSWVLISKDRH